MQKKYWLLFLFNLLCLSLFSQQYFFRNFSIDKGLPQSNVYCLLQDSRGYIWMGTDGGGVCKYDGINYEIINKNDGLSGNIIRSLFEDSNGNIWIGTDNGITIYDGINYKIISEEQGFEGSFALKIFESNDHLIWVGTNDAGLYKIKQVSDSIHVENYAVHSGLLSEFVFDIEQDQYNRLWLAMAGGISIINYNDSTFDVTKLIQYRDIPSGFVTCIEPLNNEEFIMGSYDQGAFKINIPVNLNDIKTEPFDNEILSSENIIWDIHYRNNNEILFATNDYGILKLKSNNELVEYNKENSFETNLFFNILEDKEGNIWYASFGSGVYTYIGEELISYHKKDGIQNENIISIKNVDNKLYIGTHDGLEVFTIDGKSIQLEKTYNFKTGLSGNKINTIAFDKQNRIWLGTDDGINIIDNSKVITITEKNGLNSDKITSILLDKENTAWIGTDDAYNKIVQDEIFSFTEDEGFINSEVQTIIQDKQGRIWMGTWGGLVCLQDSIYTDYNEQEGLTNLRIHSLVDDRDGNLWIGTFGGGLFKFDHQNDSMPISLIADKTVLSSNNIYSLIFSNDTSLIVGTDKGFDILKLNQQLKINKVLSYNSADGFVGSENNTNSISKDKNNTIWFGTTGGIMRFETENKTNSIAPSTYITNIKLDHENIDWNTLNVETKKWFNLPEDYDFSYKENNLTFEFNSIFLNNPNKLEYSYFLEGQSKSWAPYSQLNQIVYQGLSHGDYTFKVRAKNKYGTISNTAEFSFKIKPPFYLTWWFITIAIIVFIAVIIIYIRYREAKLRQDKIKLEKTVQERTIEIVKQKDEIEKQRDIVTSQKKEITDSINYAKNIQRAVLPKVNVLENVFSEHFLLFRPKDIVSGDFYWMTQKDNHVIFTAADCTGHGVPGAFMSMLGVSFLNKIVNEQGVTQPDLILNKLRENIINSLQQKGISEENKDGMDISLCSYDIKNNKLLFAGANNPLVKIKKVDGSFELEEIKGDRMPVAIYRKMDNFVCNEVELNKGDSIYLFSDGFVDQFGGPDGRKFMKKNFKNLLLENQETSMPELKEILIQKLEDWINYENSEEHYEQIDDIIVLGLRL